MIDAATTDPIADRAPTSHTKALIVDVQVADPIAVAIAARPAATPNEGAELVERL